VGEGRQAPTLKPERGAGGGAGFLRRVRRVVPGTKYRGCDEPRCPWRRPQAPGVLPGASPLRNISLAYVEADEPEPGTRLWRAGRDVVLRRPGRRSGRGKPRHVL